MNRLMQVFKILAMVSLLFITWCVLVLHMGVMVPPHISPSAQDSANSSGKWIDKGRFGMHQLILSGSAYGRGLHSGRLTKDLLLKQEQILTKKLETFIPSRVAMALLEIAAIRWFWGIDAYFEPWMTEEMYGVSKSASHDFDGYADTFTRQIAYHGIHEVGQMTVDQGVENMGCTAVVLPFRDSFVIGRNFDFEAGRIFDSEKILKWVFPDNGYAFVSVIWAGMVGGVTGVNEKGVFISINAAGSKDFRRYGVPSSLVLIKALQNAKTAEEAVAVIRNEKMFITDIFVVADSTSKIAYRLEKSPTQSDVIPMTGASVVTNHLISPLWKDDSFNIFRREELTSVQRMQRGETLLKSYSNNENEAALAENFVLSVLRDKGEAQGVPLTLGNRQAIDALIATHSVIYNAADAVLYVSQGPSVAGAFTGFDLRASFALRSPVSVRTLPPDPLVPIETYWRVRASEEYIEKAQALLRNKACDQALPLIELARESFSQSSGYYAALGNYLDCKGQPQKARAAFKSALDLSPAYAKQRKELEGKVKP